MCDNIWEMEKWNIFMYFDVKGNLVSLLMGRVPCELSYEEMEPFWLVMCGYIDRMYTKCLRSSTGLGTFVNLVYCVNKHTDIHTIP